MRMGDDRKGLGVLYMGVQCLMLRFRCTRSALHFSGAVGNVKITQMLCQAGADVNLGDKDGARIDIQSLEQAVWRIPPPLPVLAISYLYCTELPLDSFASGSVLSLRLLAATRRGVSDLLGG